MQTLDVEFAFSIELWESVKFVHTSQSHISFILAARTVVAVRFDFDMFPLLSFIIIFGLM